MNKALGIDIGGTAIKAAVVDVSTVELVSECLEVPTPQPANVGNVVGVVKKIIMDLGAGDYPLGIAFPGVVKNNQVLTAPNMHEDWVGADWSVLLNTSLSIINDADAAGIAEMYHGVGKNKKGSTVMLTLGTGIGTALFIDGCLYPNTELGHIRMPDGMEAEWTTSARAKQKEHLSFDAWAKRLDSYLYYLQKLLWPDRFIIGGGMSYDADSFVHLLTVPVDIQIAYFKNHAGIIGAVLK